MIESLLFFPYHDSSKMQFLKYLSSFCSLNWNLFSGLLLEGVNINDVFYDALLDIVLVIFIEYA